LFTGLRAIADGFTEVREPRLDNLVFGAPYEHFVPHFHRGGWAGSTDVSGSFARYLRKHHVDHELEDTDAESLPKKRFKASSIHVITSDSHDQATRSALKDAMTRLTPGSCEWFVRMLSSTLGPCSSNDQRSYALIDLSSDKQPIARDSMSGLCRRKYCITLMPDQYFYQHWQPGMHWCAG